MISSRLCPVACVNSVSSSRKNVRMKAGWASSEYRPANSSKDAGSYVDGSKVPPSATSSDSSGSIASSKNASASRNVIDPSKPAWLLWVVMPALISGK